MDEKVIYQILKKENPSFSESRLRATAKQIVDNPEILESVTLGGLLSKAAASKIGQGLKALSGLAGTLVARKPGGKVAYGKTAVRGGALGLAGLGVQKGFFGGGDGQDDSVVDPVQQAAEINMAMQIGKAQAEGVPIETIMNNPVAQQIFQKTPNFLTGALANSGTYVLEGQGVYTGKVTQAGGKYEGSRFVPNIPKDTIPLKDWTNQFPIADPKALAEWKAKLVAAGVVSASAGLAELKQQWEVWGEFSQNANKSGQKLTPYQLLDIQRGLWGGGGEDYSTKYSVNMLKAENVKSLYKSARQQEAGAIVGDEQAAAFAERVAAQQMAKPTKTEYKKIKGKMTPVTTPGYGEAEAAAAAIELAKKDPLYAEFQTANVFGTALERALGVRG